MLPEGWKRISLGNLAKIERGRFSVRPRNDPRYFGGSIPFVQTGDVANAGMFLSGYSQTLNELGLSVSKQFPPGTILMTIAANIGATAITKFPVACPDSVVAISPIGQKADLHWLKYALEELQPELDGMASQNAQKNINLQVLEPLQIVTPPIEEQVWIGKCLSTWDAAINLAETHLTNSHCQKQALMQLFLSRRSREWELVRVAEISERVQRQTDGEEYPVLMISSGSGFVRQDEKYSRFMAGKSLENYVLLQRGEFAYNKGNSKLYEFGCVFPLEELPYGLVPHVYVCFKLDAKCDQGFFKYLFEADYLHDQLGALVNTGVRNNGLLNIRPADFMNVRVPLPPLAEQRAIASVLETASNEIECFKKDLEALKRQKRALMQQLLTGKRRVRLPATEAARA